MEFLPNQVIWIPSCKLKESISSPYWPAKFVQISNIKNLCLVNVYPSKNVEAMPNFIIEVKDVIPFKEFSPLELHDDIIMAFKKASAEYALQNSNKNYNEVLTSKTIESACDLCEFVQQIYMETCIKRPVILPTIIKMKELPLKQSDLQLYFMRKTTQLMLYEIDNCDLSESHGLKENFQVWSQKIIHEMVENVIENKMNLMPKR